jgi:uncharacterized protein YecE (DUF72 family)
MAAVDQAAVARIGISGWRYPAWRGTFYPKKLPQRLELEYAADRLTSIEINGTFYSLQKPAYFTRWAAQTPEGFRFAVKGGRYITHLRRLREPRQALANFFASGLLALGPKLGPVLWQLPPNLSYDPDTLENFLDLLPTSTAAAAVLGAEHEERLDGRVHLESDTDRPLRHAIEVRHPSFDTARYFEQLGRHQVASVVADTAGKWPKLEQATTDFVYVRLHGDTVLYESGYDDAALERWAGMMRGWLREGRDVWAYFDNDVKVRAPFDAMALIERLA